MHTYSIMMKSGLPLLYWLASNLKDKEPPFLSTPSTLPFSLHMEARSQKVNTSIFIFFFFFFILLASHLSLAAPTTTWVGSKYQIECTMCAACDNPCDQQPPPSPPPPQPVYPPPPPPPTSTGGGYYYSPPPPTSGTGGGYYYSPPPPSQGVYYYYPPPASYKNYPTSTPPNPIMNYYPYYYYNPPMPNSSAVSLAGATTMLLINILFICFFSL